MKPFFFSNSANINKDTGVRFGYISADQLNADLVHDLMYTHGKDISYQRALEEARKSFEATIPTDGEFDAEGNLPQEFDEDRFSDTYECDEPYIEGTHEGVQYGTSWLGGALNFFIYFSPELGNYELCSPCVPNAGNLNCPNPDAPQCYDVPKDWRATE